MSISSNLSPNRGIPVEWKTGGAYDTLDTDTIQKLQALWNSSGRGNASFHELVYHWSQKEMGPLSEETLQHSLNLFPCSKESTPSNIYLHRKLTQRNLQAKEKEVQKITATKHASQLQKKTALLLGTLSLGLLALLGVAIHGHLSKIQSLFYLMFHHAKKLGLKIDLIGGGLIALTLAAISFVAHQHKKAYNEEITAQDLLKRGASFTNSASFHK